MQTNNTKYFLPNSTSTLSLDIGCPINHPKNPTKNAIPAIPAKFIKFIILLYFNYYSKYFYAY
jgi:hypothetical protein